MKVCSCRLASYSRFLTTVYRGNPYFALQPQGSSSGTSVTRVTNTRLEVNRGIHQGRSRLPHILTETYPKHSSKSKPLPNISNLRKPKLNAQAMSSLPKPRSIPSIVGQSTLRLWTSNPAMTHSLRNTQQPRRLSGLSNRLTVHKRTNCRSRFPRFKRCQASSLSRSPNTQARSIP